jgi:predicted Holliday junction resolvase-like endonuclease
MQSDIPEFFSIQRQIFGICPRSGEFFRLSDCKIYLRAKPVHDWMDKLDSDSTRLDLLEEKIEEKREVMKEKAREKGRRLARLAVKRIDPIFTPRKLNPDDAKVVFHPIDYIVFNGMKDAKQMKDVALLDRKTDSPDRRALQDNIGNVISKGNYEWLTLRVREDGSIVED